MINFKDLTCASAICLALLLGACGGSSGSQSAPGDSTIEATSGSNSSINLVKAGTDAEQIKEPVIELPAPELPCDTTPPSAYLVNYYDVTNVRYEESINDQTAFKTPIILEDQERVHWSMFSIELKAATQTYYASHKRGLTFSLFQRAEACTPLPPTATQHLVSISITSDNAFADSYPAGTELSSLMAPIKYQSFDYPNDIIANFNGANLPAPVFMNIYLLQAPQYNRQNFTIKITLDDGNTFVVETGDIYFSASGVSF